MNRKLHKGLLLYLGLLPMMSAVAAPEQKSELKGKQNQEEARETAKTEKDQDFSGVIEAVVRIANGGKQVDKKNLTQDEKLSLFKKALQFVLANGKGLRAARCEILQKLGTEATARGEFLPAVSAEAGYEYHHEPQHKEQKFASGGAKKDDYTKANTNSGSVGLKLNQNLFNGGKSVANLHSATNANKALYYQYKSKEGAAIEEVFLLLLNVIQHRILLQHNEANVKIHQEILRAELQKLQVGEVDRSEVALAESKLAKGQAKVAAIKIKLEDLEGDLLRKGGIRGEDVLLVMPEFGEFLPGTFAEVEKIANKENGDLLAGHYSAMAKKAAISAAKAGFLPRLDLDLGVSGSKSSADNYAKPSSSGSYTKTQTDEVWKGANFTAGVKLAWQFDTQGAVRTLTKGAHHDYVKTTVEGAQTRSDTMSALSTDFANLERCRDSVDANKRYVRACEVCFQGTLQELAVGAQVYTQVLKAQSDLLEAKEYLIAAQQRLAETQIRILKNMGRLGAGIFKINAFVFDPSNKMTSYESPESMPEAKVKVQPNAAKPVPVKAKIRPVPVVREA